MKNDESISDAINQLHKDERMLYIFCVIVGIFTGLIVAFYRWILGNVSVFRNYTIEKFGHRSFLYVIVLWAIFLIIGAILQLFYTKYPKISGSGIPQVKGIILRQLDYKNWFQELVAKFVSGFLAIGAGLSLGREGPSVQLGSYVAFGINKIFKRDIVDKKYLITSGASAGLAGAFGAPLAGVTFAIEELHRYISTKLLICTFLASIFSDFIGRRMFGLDTAFNIDAMYPENLNPYYQFTLYIILGIIIALLGKLFSFFLLKAQTLYGSVKVSPYLKVSVIMSASLLLCYFLPDVTGGGHTLVEELVISNNTLLILAVIFIFKLLFTVFSYATGFAGGIFLPMLVLGAVAGNMYALLLIDFAHLPSEYISHFMVLGMAGFFVAVVRAPITGTILILEMTGNFDHLLALATVSVIAYYVTDILKVAPIYDTLYERMKKDVPDVTQNTSKKTIISIPIASDSYLDGKKISEVTWGNDVLVVAITRNEQEIIPKGSSTIRGGDLITLLIPENMAFNLKEMFYKQASS